MPFKHTRESILALVDTTTNPDGCHEWRGSRDRCGYGEVHYQGRRHKAHRLVWELVNGPIPPGLVGCHKCDNPPCCRLDHLWLGTHAANMRDAAEKYWARVNADNPTLVLYVNPAQLTPPWDDTDPAEQPAHCLKVATKLVNDTISASTKGHEVHLTDGPSRYELVGGALGETAMARLHERAAWIIRQTEYLIRSRCDHLRPTIGRLRYWERKRRAALST